jgi:hypothetical protein
MYGCDASRDPLVVLQAVSPDSLVKGHLFVVQMFDIGEMLSDSAHMVHVLAAGQIVLDCLDGLLLLIT